MTREYLIAWIKVLPISMVFVFGSAYLLKTLDQIESPETEIKAPKYLTIEDLKTTLGHQYFALLIDKEFREAKNKMMFEHPEAILKAKDEYMRTGKCKKHIWIESHPIKTSEGEFIIKNCLICKLAYVNYKNKRIKGKMFELVNFLAMRNIHNLEKEKKKTQIFSMKNIIK